MDIGKRQKHYEERQASASAKDRYAGLNEMPVCALFKGNGSHVDFYVDNYLLSVTWFRDDIVEGALIDMAPASRATPDHRLTCTIQKGRTEFELLPIGDFSSAGFELAFIKPNSEYRFFATDVQGNIVAGSDKWLPLRKNAPVIWTKEPGQIRPAYLYIGVSEFVTIGNIKIT
jgi:hypothetical protein